MRNRQFLLSAAAVAALGLAGCNQHAEQTPAAPATGAPIASLPLAEGAPPPLVAAPGAAALPSAPPVRTVTVPARQRYRYIDRAYDLGEAFADSPPDYTVDYEGVRPWIWRSNGGQYRVVEQTPDGPRIYYYDAGSDEPFLVRDPRYAYGYDDGGLAVIYGADGRLMDYDSEAADRAARYLARARGLYRAAVHEQRQAAYASAWQSRRTEVLGEQRAWGAEQQRDSGWRDWRQANQQPPSQDWNRERSLREAYTRQTAAVVAAAALSANRRPPGPTNAAPQPFAPPAGQGPNGNAGRDAQAAQLRAQQQAQAAQQQAQAAQQQAQQASQQKAQADRDAQRAAREKSQAAAQAQGQAQAQQQKAQADREAQRAARERSQAAEQAQAQQQKGQADREAQRAARQQAKAAADGQAQQQKAQADREAQRAAREQAKATADAQAQQQKAQADREAQRAARQQAKAAADGQAQQQKAQADREAQRAAREQAKAAADGQAQQQKAQADREAQRAARQQAKATAEAQAQAQQAQQQKAQAQQEADRAARQQARAAKQAQDAQQAQAQAKAAQPAAKPKPSAEAAKPLPGQGNGGRDREHPHRDKTPDQN